MHSSVDRGSAQRYERSIVQKAGLKMTEFMKLNSGYTQNPYLPQAHRKTTAVVTACFILPTSLFSQGPNRK